MEIINNQPVTFEDVENCRSCVKVPPSLLEVGDTLSMQFINQPLPDVEDQITNGNFSSYWMDGWY